MPVISLSEILHNRQEIVPTIYGYEATNMPDHDGFIKVGYTDKEDYESRIREQTSVTGVKYRIVYVASAMRSDGTCFTDHDVHRIFQRKHISRHFFNDRNEWYRCGVDEIEAAVYELKTGERLEGIRTWTFGMRKEQQTAVDATAEYFARMAKEEPDRAPKFLWNAKMRFGKTFATYQLSKKMGFKRILVLTFKPAVESAWWEDLAHHVDFDGWQFVSNKEAKFDAQKLDEMYAACDKSKPIVVFGSFQDILGTNDVGGIKAKNEFIHSTNWDLVTFDEYHFGAWRDTAKKLFEKFDEEDQDFDIETYQKEEAGDAINETFLPITSGHYLYLSGTPFRAINSGEFLEDQIFNWTYSDEQREKENWAGDPEKNPYAALPRMIMMTYKIPDSITSVAINEGLDGFDINEFFKATYEKGTSVETAKFVYEEYVQKWLDLIQGKYMPVDGLKLGNDKPPMPFSDTTLLNVLSHTLWFLPDVASCYAMANLLAQKQNVVGFGNYKVIVCAGTKAGIGLDALPPVLNAMDDPLKTRTITLSCGKLTTGVTVRPWTGVFMLRNLKSPETYFQTAFRVQSPWVVDGELGKKVIVKEECYVFDFALERALKQISDYSCSLKVDEESAESKVAEFINFLPVLAFDGSSMNRINAQDILDITYSGTSATLLAKRWQTALLVHVDNDTLKRLKDNPEALEALNGIEGFRNLNEDISTIINRSEKLKKLKKDNKKFSEKEKKELTQEAKELKSLRKQTQENLLKLAARIPAFMYLSDYRERRLTDVITQIEPELFRSVTGLTVKNFDTLCSIGLFDSDKMNQGVYGFRNYESASLTYTGIDMHEGEAVGGWDTVLRREEYEELYAKQQGTLSIADAIVSEQDVADYAGQKAVEEAVEKKVSEQYTEETEVDEHLEEEKRWLAILEKVQVGAEVVNKVLGPGVVIREIRDRRYIEVQFDGGIKTFPFPRAFLEGSLWLKDQDRIINNLRKK